MRIHFVCRGNAFRSRLAESYYTSLNLNTPCVSSGTIAEAYKEQNIETVERVDTVLSEQNLPVLPGACTQLTQERIQPDDHVVFVNKIAFDEAQDILKDMHNPYTIWDIADYDEQSAAKPTLERGKKHFAEATLEQIKTQVDKLVTEKQLP